jgi:hypothetical protein
MAIPPAKEPTVSRLFEEYTVGGGPKVTDKPAAVAVGTANIGNPASLIQVVGIAMKVSPAIAVAALAAGATATVTVNFGIIEFPAYAVSIGRELRMLTSAGAYHAITGLSLMSVQPTGIAVSVGTTLNGFVFAGGTTYTSFSVNIVVTYIAAIATLAGNVFVWLNASLWDAQST